MNKYGRATKMTSPPPGMPPELAAKYAATEGRISSMATMNRGLLDGKDLKSKGYDPNEMVDIKDFKTGKTSKVPFGSYEHQMFIATPNKAANFMGIGTKDLGVQRIKGKDLEPYNTNEWELRSNAGLKATELRFAKGDKTGYDRKTGEVGPVSGTVYQVDYITPQKGVTDLPSRYAKEEAIKTEYQKEKDDLARRDADWAEMNKPMVAPKVKRDLPKLQGKISPLPGETTWNDPKAEKYKTKREIVKNREGGQDQRVKILSKKIGGGYGIRTSKTGSTEEVAKGIRYNREQKMAKAFYSPESVVGGGYSSKNWDDAWDDQGYSKNMAKEIKTDLKSIRQEKKDYIADKGRNPSDARGEYNKAIKTAKLASRYAKRADISASGDEGKWREGEGSKLKYFTPDYEKYSSKKVKGAMSGYVEAGKQEKSRMNQLQGEAGYKVYPWSKTAEQNVVNRNSTSERMKKFWGY